MKYLIFLFACVFTLSTYAAYQYNTKGNQTWLTFDSNTNLYFDVSRSGKTNDHENFIDRGEGIADWGWYNLNTNESGSFKNGGEFTFTENDKIAVWVKDERGNTYASTKNTSDFIWGKSDLKDDIFKVYGGNKGSNGSHEYYIFTVTSAPSKNNAPTGQPLPGIIGTLLVGGAGLWYLKNRKNLLKK
jgi:LPXTG-motif cell wall-anchored protein